MLGSRHMKAHFILRTPMQRSALSEFLLSVPAEPVHEVIVREWKSKRSNPQNDKFHALCQDAGNYIGCSTEEAKRMIKADLLGTIVVEKEGFKFEVLRSTAQLNVQEMSELIEQATAWCIERDIPLRQFAYEYA